MEIFKGTFNNPIFFGSPLCGHIEEPTIVRSPYRTNEVMFRSLGSRYGATSDLGFNMTYKIFNCGGILNGPMDTIRSLNFPQQYPDNADCVWLLEYPEGEQIVVSV